LNRIHNIGIAGNIGVGKTTLTDKISKDLGLEPVYESVINNPYLHDFYADMSRWSFNLQIYFLYTRFESQIRHFKMNKSFIQDRTIYEDKEIFATNLYELGHMSERDYNTYCDLFNSMLKFIKKPDLIVYLKASTDTLMSRINTRKRTYEADISSEYIHSLNIYYNKWINKIDSNNVLIVKTDDFNIFKDIEFYNDIVQKIKDSLDA
tara:strand:+ start:6906 stop:7526 length:621 start_codon:yes stop_codon:yes gene_type:complete